MKFLPNHAPVLRGNELRYLRECVRTGWVSSAGPFVGRLEAETARYTGARHAVATSTGTAALHVALQLAGVERGDLVLVPDLTFMASANAAHYLGAEPVFVDVDPETWQLDPAKVARFLDEECVRRGTRLVERRSGRRVRAIMAVHILGGACDARALAATARRHGIALVEDAAEGLGVRLAGRHVGTFGLISALSFNGNKLVTAGGGGMILTADARLAARARYLTTQAKDDAEEFIHHEVGYNYRMTNLQAAVGLAQLERVSWLLERKKKVAAVYAEGLPAIPGISWMAAAPGVEESHWLFTLLLPPGTSLERRKRVVRRLNAAGVGARGLWHPMHSLRPHLRCRAYGVEHSPDLYRRAVSLPSGAGLSPADARRCLRALRDALAS